MPCFYCDKGILYGRTHTHHRGVAGGRWKKRAPKKQRIFEPNLQKMDIMEDGEVKRVRLCTRCLKKIKKDLKEGKKPFLSVVKLQPKKEAKKEVKKEKKAAAKK